MYNHLHSNPFSLTTTLSPQGRRGDLSLVFVLKIGQAKRGYIVGETRAHLTGLPSVFSFGSRSPRAYHLVHLRTALNEIVCSRIIYTLRLRGEQVLENSKDGFRPCTDTIV